MIVSSLTKSLTHPHEKSLLICFSDYTIEDGFREMKAFKTYYEITLGMLIALNKTGLNVADVISPIGFNKLNLFDVMFPSLPLVKQP